MTLYEWIYKLKYNHKSKTMAETKSVSGNRKKKYNTALINSIQTAFRQNQNKF